MEKKNFFTSGWLFLSIAILNMVVAGIFGPLVISSPGSLDEWFAPLCFLIPMSVALAIVNIFIPRGKIGAKRVFAILLNALAAVIYLFALCAIVYHWAYESDAYYCY